MKILKTVQRVPGGMMVVPLIIAAIIHTFLPSVLQIGSFTTAIFSSAGVGTLIGLQLFFIGTKLKLRQAPEALKRGVVLLVAKYAAGALLGLIVAKIFGVAGVLGISVLAIVSSVTGANGALYLALMGQYGETADSAAMSVLNIHDGPFLAMLTLGVTGLAHIPITALVAALVPLVVGVILGNLDHDFEKLFGAGTAIVIPFNGFTIGAGIDLTNVVKAGLSGILLGLAVMIIGGGCTFLADRYILRRPGYAGAGLAAAAGNTIATPAAVALVDSHYKPYVASATVQIASAVVMTSILVPLITGRVAKRFGRGQEVLRKEGSVSAETAASQT
ncbi:2-keto-3-deoxygluconate permease [Alicyclobacillus fastidiosus]|uniref:2-keto-3-deoxygluconate permease n=1 Tax=Alicyclobacillus fastidiosus TaxID=392011 RepID=A0ABY6ZJK4_9BACL|nr:2-keto-3-deoxygluconate permease [Alicyclobacillus fastidiosus]WAH43110.1 2-keto-3-deoxygluconate permease [Alicyclobacillus fastidiosus]